MEQDFQLLLPDKEATRAFGYALAESIDERAVIGLCGNIGAGKTTLVKSIAAAMGVTEVVNSPTFTMLNEYHSGRLPIFHMDLYRLAEDKTPAPLDLLMAEIEEFVESEMILLIEWAELFPTGPSDGSLLNQLDHLIITLSPDVPHSAFTTSPANQAADQTHYASASDPDILNRSAEQTEALQLSDSAKRINKDEEVRVVSIRTFGNQSAELAERLRTRVAAMLIYP